MTDKVSLEILEAELKAAFVSAEIWFHDHYPTEKACIPMGDGTLSWENGHLMYSGQSYDDQATLLSDCSIEVRLKAANALEALRGACETVRLGVLRRYTEATESIRKFVSRV